MFQVLLRSPRISRVGRFSRMVAVQCGARYERRLRGGKMKAFWRKVPEARRSKKRGSASMRQNPRAPAIAECFLSRPRPPLGPARLPFKIICSSHPPPSPSSVDIQRYALGVLSGLRASGLGFPHGDTPARSSSRLVRLRAGPSRPFRAGSATRLARVSCDRASARPFRAPPSLQRILTLQKEML